LLRDTAGVSHDSPLVRWTKRVYGRLLPPFLAAPRLTAAGGVLLTLAAAAIIPLLGLEFLPEFREANFIVGMRAKPDSSLEYTLQMGQLVSRRMMQNGGVLSVAQQAGRADLSEDTWGPDFSEIWVTIDDSHGYQAALDKLRESYQIADPPDGKHP